VKDREVRAWRDLHARPARGDLVAESTIGPRMTEGEYFLTLVGAQMPSGDKQLVLATTYQECRTRPVTLTREFDYSTPHLPRDHRSHDA
jgi:hypothetical protein